MKGEDKALLGYRKFGVAAIFVYFAAQAHAWKWAAGVTALYLIINFLDNAVTLSLKKRT